jgi:hypothetical protein
MTTVLGIAIIYIGVQVMKIGLRILDEITK